MIIPIFPPSKYPTARNPVHIAPTMSQFVVRLSVEKRPNNHEKKAGMPLYIKTPAITPMSKNNPAAAMHTPAHSNEENIEKMVPILDYQLLSTILTLETI